MNPTLLEMEQDNARAKARLQARYDTDFLRRLNADLEKSRTRLTQATQARVEAEDTLHTRKILEGQAQQKVMSLQTLIRLEQDAVEERAARRAV